MMSKTGLVVFLMSVQFLEEIELFQIKLGFKLEKKYTVGFKLGCNEFLFKKEKYGH